MPEGKGRLSTWLTTKQGLIARKAFIAFLVGFLGVLIPALLNILDSVANGAPFDWGTSLLASLIAGAFAAGIRAVLAISPLNLSSTDQLTSIGSKTDAVTVTTRNPE
jgi:hypothetical protein